MPFWTSNKVGYTSSDAAEIVSQSLNRLSILAGDEVYLTLAKDSVLTAQQAQIEVDEILSGDGGRTSIGLISAKLDLDKSLIKQIVQRSKCKNFYTNNDHVLTSGEVTKLESQLRDQVGTEGYVKTLSACSLLQIDSKVLMWILNRLKDHSGLVLDNDLIISSTVLNFYRTAIVNKLNSLQEPTALTEIDLQMPEPLDKRFKDPQWVRSSEEIEGTVDNRGMFVPKDYADNEAKRVIDQLNEHGKVEVKTKEQERIIRTAKADVEFVNGVAITSEYIAQLASEVNQQIADKGYAENKADFDLILGTVKARPVYFKNKLQYLVSKQFIDSLAKKRREELMASVSKHAADLFHSDRDKVLDTLDNEQDIRRYVEQQGLTESRVCMYENTTVPQSVVQFSLTRHSKSIATDYNTALQVELRQVAETYQREVTAKVQVYALGVESVEDAKLANRLFLELAIYASDHLNLQSASISSVQDLNAQLKHYVKNDLLATKEQLMERLERQLKDSSDAALVLHLAALVAHARLPKNDGLLRATGKHVPKILRILTAHDATRYGDFVRLKEAVLNGNKNMQQKLMGKVKQQVLD